MIKTRLTSTKTKEQVTCITYSMHTRGVYQIRDNNSEGVARGIINTLPSVSGIHPVVGME